LKQTKEARVFRRAQAGPEVVKGQRLHTVSETLDFAMPRCASGSIVLPTKVRQASWTAPALADRPRLRASWQSTSIASSIQTHWTTALFMSNGVAPTWRPSSPAKPGATRPRKCPL
jgi:hypothetical protein